ncbi:MAG: hypothetical protein IJV88_06745 [Ruminococcus sp.]|nr:hypothetical protein [Ruminococcus sp.]
MKNKVLRALAMLMVMLLAASAMLTFAGCKKKVNNDYIPTDNDTEGWFSTEVLAEYNAAGFSLPKGAEVQDKPERNTLYLTGDDEVFQNSARYAYSAIQAGNDKIYQPVYEINDQEVAEVTAIKEISGLNTTNLYPDGEETTVTLIYESGNKILECAVTVESESGDSDRVCISFNDRTEQYKDLF